MVKGFLSLSAALLATLICSNVLGVNTVPQGSWQRIAPAGESFSVLMPMSASEGTRRVSLGGKDTYPRAYYCLADGKRYLVLSFAKTKPEWQDSSSSFDMFVGAMEGIFKGQPDSLVFDQEGPSAANPVRQYHGRIGNSLSVARLIGTYKAFYAVVVIGAEATSREADQFLSSFTPGPVNGESSNVIVNGEAYLDPESMRTSGGELPPEPWTRPMLPISGGILNGKALSLFRPEYPAEARGSGGSGEVRIKIVIDEQGKVIAARALEGPKSLQSAALAAALKSRFSPTRLSGQPMKVMGVLIYRFVR